MLLDILVLLYNVIIKTMEIWQKSIILVYGLVSFIGFLKGLWECKNKKNSYGITRLYNIIGAFVWSDVVVFGPFWTLVSLFAYYLNNWILFLFILSVFWVVRSLGETIYWFNQQFSTINRNPPEKLLFHNIFHDDSVWWVYQIFWQCITVVSIIFSVYFAKLWLSG